MRPWRSKRAFSLVSILVGAAFVRAQDSKIQQLGGGYLGTVSVRSVGFPVDLAITRQVNRSFEGTLSYIEQDKLRFGGTIAASDICKINATGGDTTSLLVDWLSAGDDGALLRGQVVVNHEEQADGLIGLLRSFSALGNDGSQQLGARTGRLTSISDGTSDTIVLTAQNGAASLLAGEATLGGNALRVVGSSSSRNPFLLVGTGLDVISSISAEVKINERGQPVSIEGTYEIQTPKGMTVDNGIIAILIG